MDVRIFETSDLCFVVAEVINTIGCCGGGCDTEGFFVKNPRSLQVVPAVDPETGQPIPQQVNIQLISTVLIDLLKDPEEGYLTEFKSCGYTDVTDKFPDNLVEMYKELEKDQQKRFGESVDDSEGSVGEADNVVKFKN